MSSNTSTAPQSFSPTAAYTRILNEKERALRDLEQRLYLAEHGVHGPPRNRHERRRAAKVLRARDVRRQGAK